MYLYPSFPNSVNFNFVYVTGPVKINHVSTKNRQFFSSFGLCSIITYELLICTNKKLSITTAEFNGLSSELYGKEIPHSALKILVKI